VLTGASDAVTIAVGAEGALLVPTLFDAVTLTRIVEPTSEPSACRPGRLRRLLRRTPLLRSRSVATGMSS